MRYKEEVRKYRHGARQERRSVVFKMEDGISP